MASREDEVFGQRVRERREELGWAQARLGEELADFDRTGTGLSQSAIARVEAGQRGVTIAEARAFAKVLGVTIESLIASPMTNRQVTEALEAALALFDGRIEKASAELAEAKAQRANVIAKLTASRKAERKYGADTEHIAF